MKLGIAIALLLSGVILSGAYAAQEKHSTISVPVTVHAGDTLWSICEREAENVGDNRDLREIICETTQANEIKNGGLIVAGQKLIVKVQKHE